MTVQTTRPGGLHAFMTRWNELAVEADKLGGIKGVKAHTSEFESYVISEKRVAWLEAQITALQSTSKTRAGVDTIKAAAQKVSKKDVAAKAFLKETLSPEMNAAGDAGEAAAAPKKTRKRAKKAKTAAVVEG